MPDKKEYDDELVQLLARGELADRQIACRLGLNVSQVSRIARGEKRPELQPRILAAMRETLKAAWKNGGRLDSESGEASPATPVAGKTAKTAFDRHLAVELIAAGQLTLSQIASRLGIHKTAAWRIATGRSHPELQPLIREAQQHYRDRARRIGVKWSAQIVTKQIQVGLKNNGWVGLRARQDLLDRFLGPEDERAESEVPPADRDFGPELRDLPEPLKRQVVEALGGPDPAEDDLPFVHWNDPSTWRPVGAAAEKSKNPATDLSAVARPSRATKPASAGEVASAEAEASAKVEVAGKRANTAPPSGLAPGAESPQPGVPMCIGTPQNHDAASPPSAEPPPEEGCSRNKKRRNRQRREVKSFIR